MAPRHGLLFFVFFLFALSSSSTIMATSRAMLSIVPASATFDEVMVPSSRTTPLVELSTSSRSNASFPVVLAPTTFVQVPTSTTSTVTFNAESIPSTSEAMFVVGSGSSISMPPSSDNFVAFEVPNGMDARPPMSNWVIRGCKPKGRIRYSAPSDRRNNEPLVSIVCSNMS